MCSRTGTVKPRHTPLVSGVSYDNAVNSTPRAGFGSPGGQVRGSSVAMAKGCLLLCFACQHYPWDALCARAVWHLPRQHLGGPRATDTHQPLWRDPCWGWAAGSIVPKVATAPSKAPKPFTCWSWIRSLVLLLQPSWQVFSPRYCTVQQTPSFPLTRPAPPKTFSAFPPFSSDRTHIRAFPARAKLHSLSPTLCKLRGTLPALPRGQLTKHLSLPWPNRKGLGSRSPARVPGAGRSCLASILSRYKTRFQKSEPFHWQEMEAARGGQLPQLQFPARPLSQPCFLHVLQTHAWRMRLPDTRPAPTGGLHPHRPPHSPEAAGTTAKWLVPASIRSRVAPLEQRGCV